MNPGEFRHTVDIIVGESAQQSDYGDYLEEDLVTYTRYAKVKWLPGSEKIEAEEISLERNVEFTFRFESVTKLLDRIDKIEYQTQTYHISSIQFRGYANQQYVVIKANTFTD